MAHYMLSTVLEALYVLTPLILTKTQELLSLKTSEKLSDNSGKN